MSEVSLSLPVSVVHKKIKVCDHVQLHEHSHVRNDFQVRYIVARQLRFSRAIYRSPTKKLLTKTDMKAHDYTSIYIHHKVKTCQCLFQHQHKFTNFQPETEI